MIIGWMSLELIIVVKKPGQILNSADRMGRKDCLGRFIILVWEVKEVEEDLENAGKMELKQS